MYQRFKTIKGFFDQLVHYKDGIKVGESWPSFFKGSYTTTTPTAPALATPILAYLVPMSITMNLAAESVKHGRMTSGSVATILPTRVTSVLPMMASSAAQHILTIPHAVFSMTRLTVPMWRIRMREATGK